MVGGRNSFSSGGWKGTPIEKMLPVKLSEDLNWRGDVKVSLRADLSNQLHPLFRMEDEEERNLATVGALPGFHGVNAGLMPKSDLTQVLAIATPGSLAAEVPQPAEQPSSLFSRFGFGRKKMESVAESDGTLPAEFAAITVGQYGKGRTVAMAMPITGAPAEKFLEWGRSEGEREHYQQFWRNLTYWLTEQSYVGRRRLVVDADKRYYGPGETITLTGAAFDESSNPTSGYRLVGVIEPQSFDNIESDYSIVLWPDNVPREEESESPFIIWGEEFEIPVQKVGDKEFYQTALNLAETLPSGTANQSLRLELTAYEGQTQVDSTSVPIQILHDPFEQQNPFPNHELLEKLAEASGGQVLTDEEELANMLTSMPIRRGPPELRKSPIWSNWWTMAAILGLITTEWCYRRWIGLA